MFSAQNSTLSRENINHERPKLERRTFERAEKIPSNKSFIIVDSKALFDFLYVLSDDYRLPEYIEQAIKINCPYGDIDYNQYRYIFTLDNQVIKFFDYYQWDNKFGFNRTSDFVVVESVICLDDEVSI